MKCRTNYNTVYIHSQIEIHNVLKMFIC